MNRKRFLALLACLILVGVGIHAAYDLQVKRNARDLFREAEDLERQGRFEEAAQRLNRYLRSTPGDAGALALYGSLLKRLAKTQGDRITALLVLEQALRRDGQRKESRREAAELA